jgi:hypothetical protein
MREKESPRALLLLRCLPRLVMIRRGLLESRRAKFIFFSVQEINCVINQVINGRINTVVPVRILWIMTQTWDAPHDLSKPHYINLDVNISLYTTYVTMFF